MRRTDFAVTLDNTEWLDTGRQPESPQLVIQYDGSEIALAKRFLGTDGSGYTPDELDLFYREQVSDSPLTSNGVLGVSDRITGEYLFEINTSTAVIEEFAYAIRQYAEASETPARYEVALWVEDSEVAVFTKETFLVYQPDGTLLRHQSLTPRSIEP